MPRESLPGPPPSNQYEVPRSIASDCSRDVTTQLIAWMNSVPNNSTLNFSSGACYRIDGTLPVSDRTGLTFNGRGATFDGSNNAVGSSRHWRINHSSQITLRNMTVRGANPNAGAWEGAYKREMEGQAAYAVQGSQNVLLDNVRASDLYGDFVEVTPYWWRQIPVPSRNVTVQNSHFERGGRQGVSVTGAQDVLIQDNYIGGVPHDILDLEPEIAAVSIDNVRFIRNRTGPVWLVWFANHGRCNAGVSNITVSDNVMEARATNDYAAVWVDPPAGCPRRGPFTFERNTLLLRQPPTAFNVEGTHDVLIRANSVHYVYARRTRVLANLKTSTRTSVLSNQVTADHRDQVVFVTTDGSDYVSSGNRRI